MPRQKKASRSLRSDPAGIASPQGEVSAQTFPLFEKLGSLVPEEREDACNSLANIVLEDNTALDILLADKALHTLISRLSDPVSAVRISAAGALRNVSLAGGEKACDRLAECACSAPLLLALSQVRDLDDITTPLLKQGLALLANLCESNDTVASEVLESAAGTLLSLLTHEKCDAELQLQVAQLLHIITDGQEESEFSQKGDCFIPLGSLLRSPTVTNPQLRALIAGVLVNLGCAKTEPDFMAAMVMPIIEASLEIDCAQTLLQLAPAMKDPSQGTQLLTTWFQNLSYQQLCLELMANICGLVDSSEETDSTTHLPLYLRNDGLVFRVLEKATARCLLDKKSIMPLQEELPHLRNCVAALSRLQLSALHCIGNILLVLGPLEHRVVSTLWAIFCQLCDEGFANQQLELLETVTGSMWTLLRNTVSSDDNPVDITPGLLEGIIHLANNGSLELRTNTIGMLAFLARRVTDITIMQKIAQTLLVALAFSIDGEGDLVARLQLLVEALNTIFDLFAEIDHNGIVHELQMLAKLKSVIPVLERLLKQPPDIDEDLMVRLDEAQQNLCNFLSYKEEQK